MDPVAYFRFLAALLFVLALIGLVAWSVRRFRLSGTAPTGARRRLQVVEMLPLDPRRRLVLVRRDTTEHLLLIGDAGNRVIETRLSGAWPPDPAPSGADASGSGAAGGASS